MNNNQVDLSKQKKSKSNQQLSHAESSSEDSVFPLSILANNIEIAGNVGSLFRVADALGVEKLYLTGTTQTPPKYKIRKAARSADNHIPYIYKESAVDVIETLKANGYTIVALEITTKSENIRDFKLNKQEKTCLIIGSENLGISADLLALSDHHIHIPMYGKNSSMNVITSCAITVHELIQHL
ncbi:MAG: TrmH family RNA methyltransferase [Cocleimonas sp.]